MLTALHAMIYSDDPAAALAGFANGGAEEAHLVDLDGARAGEGSLAAG